MAKIQTRKIYNYRLPCYFPKLRFLQDTVGNAEYRSLRFEDDDDELVEVEETQSKIRTDIDRDHQRNSY